MTTFRLKYSRGTVRNPAGDLEVLDPRKQAITVEHLLTMSAGWIATILDLNSVGNENTMQSQTGRLILKGDGEKGR